jgi:hypothetical protein
MARKVSVAKIPPLLSHQSDRGEEGFRLAPTRMTRPKRSQQAELPDLLEAFWGDRASDSDAQGSPRVRSWRGAPPEV